MSIVQKIPERGPSWQYLHYLEIQAQRNHRMAVAWMLVAVMSTLALAAVSTLTTWWS